MLELTEKVVSENSFVFSGRLEIDHLNEKYQLGIEESEEYDTLAGYIIYHHNNIPKVNENLRVEGFQIKIMKVNANRIDLVELIRDPEN